MAMRILFATASFHPETNGVATFLQNIAPVLRERGHEVLIICPSRTIRNEHRLYRGVRVFGVGSLPFLLNTQFRFPLPLCTRCSIAREFRAFQPHIVHVQDFFPICAAALHLAEKAGIPTVGTHHTDVGIYEHYLPLPARFLPSFRRHAWAYLCRHFSRMTAVTAPTKTAVLPLSAAGLKRAVRIISNGVQLASFARLPADVSQTRQRFHLPEKPILISVGRLDAEKNVQHILQAFPAVRQSVDAHLLIVGHGSERAMLERLAEELGIRAFVTFTGLVPQDALPQLLAVADCFVIASTTETQSLATVEAMAASLPVVAVDALALPELVEHGENGFLFAPGDTGALAAALIRILGDHALRERMGRRSRELVEKHDIRRVAEAFEALYGDVCSFE